jgi:hypothetical protein
MFRRKRNLIDQHPRHWRSLLLHDLDRLPEAPGLYAALKGRRILYIGKSINLRERWQGGGHHRYEQLRRIGRIRLHWIRLNASAIHAKEKELIKRWKPTLNNKSVPVYSAWKTFSRWAKLIAYGLLSLALILALRFPNQTLDLAQQIWEQLPIEASTSP